MQSAPTKWYGLSARTDCRKPRKEGGNEGLCDERPNKAPPGLFKWVPGDVPRTPGMCENMTLSLPVSVFPDFSHLLSTLCMFIFLGFGGRGTATTSVLFRLLCHTALYIFLTVSIHYACSAERDQVARLQSREQCGGRGSYGRLTCVSGRKPFCCVSG